MLASTSATIWYTMRATGVVALILLTGTMVLGILTAGRTGSRAWPAFARADLHKRISLLAMVFLALHVLTAVVDTYVNVGWGAIVIPFASPFRPLWTGLGTVGVDLMLAVAVSSALRQRINPRTWRGIHWLAYGSWPVAMAHSLGMGTDAWVLWMDVVFGVCTAAVAGALFWRIGQHRASKERAALVGASTHTVPLRPAPRVVRSSGSSSMSGRNPSGARTPSVTTRVLEKERP